MTEARLKLGSTSLLSRVIGARERHHDATRSWANTYKARVTLTDFVAVALSCTIATLITIERMPASSPAEWALGGSTVALLWLCMLAAFHTRDRRIFGAQPTEYKRVISATTTTFGLAAIAVVATDFAGARDYVLIALPTGLVLLLVGRKWWRESLTRAREHGRALSRAIVVGETADVHYVIAQLTKHTVGAFTFVGSLDPSSEEGGSKPTPSTIVDMVRTSGADTVIIASELHRSDDVVRRLSWQLEGSATDLVLASRLVDVAGPRIHFRPVEGVPLIHVELPQFAGPKHVAKRIFDIVGAAAGLVLVAPLMLLVALIITLNDGGPVLYRQERVGRNERRFTMYKFRSMVVDADARLGEIRELDEGNGTLFKIKADPRVTSVGQWLRKYSMDELPQLWNVLLGNMSLVGPRPPLGSEVDAYDEHTYRRLYIKPGLTGMWQIGGRSDLSWDESVRLDLYYVENWSLIGDLVILWRTIRVVFKPIGAY